MAPCCSLAQLANGKRIVCDSGGQLVTNTRRAHRKLGAFTTLLVLSMPAYGHRLDEYLQATIFSIAKSRIRADIRLVPGVTVFPVVMAVIDKDADGAISESERRLYANAVVRDLSFEMDDERVQPRILSIEFPPVADMREGRGEIRLALDLAVPGDFADRRLNFENRHQSRIATYLVNCLVPNDPSIRIAAQHRNEDQSNYELKYLQPGAQRRLSFLTGRFAAGLLAAAAALLAMTRFAWTRSRAAKRA